VIAPKLVVGEEHQQPLVFESFSFNILLLL